MSWADDTDKLLADGLQDYTVTVKNYSSTFLTSSVYPTEGGTTIETSTVNIFPDRGAFRKTVEGRVIESTDTMFFPATSSVAVSHRVYDAGATDYFEVMNVQDFEGHKEVHTRKVEGR